jgi:hypothetical protein
MLGLDALRMCLEVIRSHLVDLTKRLEVRKVSVFLQNPKFSDFLSFYQVYRSLPNNPQNNSKRT